MISQDSKDYRSAFTSYHKALAALPKEELSSTDAYQKRQCDDAIAEIERLFEEEKKRKQEEEDKKAAARKPWEVAQPMLAKLKAAGTSGRNSSAWTVMSTYRVRKPDIYYCLP
jgi:hypothetical protein